MRIELPSAVTIPSAELDQFVGPWCIYPEHADRLCSLVSSINWQAHERQRSQQESFVRIGNGSLARVDISGTMTKRGSSLSDEGSTLLARRQIRSAAADETVAAILLAIESPGGSVAGTKELADEVRLAAGRKKVIASIEDIGASAAYYVASQATEIYANGPAIVGSVGTYMVVVDASKAAEQEGFKVLVIKSAEFKGAGTLGTEITDEQVAQWQQLIDQTDSFFTSAVKSGRNLSQSQLDTIATGQVWLAADALSLGLIDGVRTTDEVIDSLMEEIMSNEKPKAATVQELRSALPGADSDFILELASGGATLEDAKDAWIVECNDRLAKQQQEIDAAKEKESKAGEGKKGEEKTLGFDVLKNEDTDTYPSKRFATVADEWRSLVSEKRAKGMTAADATLAVNRENPGLREALLAEAN